MVGMIPEFCLLNLQTHLRQGETAELDHLVDILPTDLLHAVPWVSSADDTGVSREVRGRLKHSRALAVILTGTPRFRVGHRLRYTKLPNFESNQRGPSR